MSRIFYYINNQEVECEEFYQHDFSSIELELLFEGVIVMKNENEYRIFREADSMKYDNNFYRGFNGKKKNIKNGGKTDMRKIKKTKPSTSRVSRPYSISDEWDDWQDDFYYDRFKGVDLTKKKRSIAYGSNLNKAQMVARCPHAKPVYKGLLSDYELFYAGSKTGNYATIRKCKGKKVPVGVWEIDGIDEYYLDMYEGYPTFYFKDAIKFLTEDGKEHEAMVYIMRLDAKEGIPSIYYEKTIRQGYKDFGFDEKYLDDSIMATMERVLAG